MAVEPGSTREQQLETALKVLVAYAKNQQASCAGCCGPGDTVKAIERRGGWNPEIAQAIDALMVSNPETTRIPPWNLPAAHTDNLLIEIGILKQTVGWLSREVEKLMKERVTDV